MYNLKKSRGIITNLYRKFSSVNNVQSSNLLSSSLKESDPIVYNIIEGEKKRQRDSLVLIASENFTSRAVLDGLGSVMQNKYSEGYPGARYYGGNEYIDQMEILCRERALKCFNLDPNEWGVNVQSLSGSPANFAVYTAVLGPHGRLMALDLPHGGHLSHGYQLPNKKISAVSMFFESLPYRLDESTGLIDYDMMAKVALLYRPQLLVGGASAYSRHVDYERMREISNSVGALLMSDMAHISGLVAAGVSPSPFEHADIVTTTTHKSLRGPRGSMIFYRKDKDLEEKILSAVFPGLQGGPHNHTITALTTALKQASTEEFKAYSEQVVKNSKHLCHSLQERGYTIVSGGTDNHMMLVDLRPKGLTGSKVDTVLDLINVALNKNTVPGDRSAMNPGGIRVGTPALTSRGFVESDFEQVAEFIHRGVQLAEKVQSSSGKKLKDFKHALENNDEFKQEIQALKQEVVEFSRRFPVIGQE